MLHSYENEETMRLTFYVVGELLSFTVICLLRFMYVQVWTLEHPHPGGEEKLQEAI